MNLAEYIEGDTRLHQIKVAYKIVGLFLFSTLLFLIHHWGLLMGLLLMILFYALWSIKIGVKRLIRSFKPLLWLIISLFVVQLIFFNLSNALEVTLRLITLLLGATLFTLTTKTSDLVIAIEKGLNPFRPLGVNPEKVSLAISLVFRFIPLLSQVMAQVKEAQHVRGLNRSVLALTLPFIIQSLKMSDNIAQAIDARDPL